MEIEQEHTGSYYAATVNRVTNYPPLQENLGSMSALLELDLPVSLVHLRFLSAATRFVCLRQIESVGEPQGEMEDR